MYPSLGSGTTQPSAPTISSTKSMNTPLSNSAVATNQIEFSSLMSQSHAQNTSQTGRRTYHATYSTSSKSSTKRNLPHAQSLPETDNPPGYLSSNTEKQRLTPPQERNSLLKKQNSQTVSNKQQTVLSSGNTPLQNSFQTQQGTINNKSLSLNSPNSINNRFQTIAAKYEISNALIKRLDILKQYEIVVLCDDSGSMNTPVDGMRTRWDELKMITQIVIEIGTIFDSNGVDIYFLNRSPMLNVTDPRQITKLFNQRPQGFTPITPILRQIFQSETYKSSNGKNLLVFIATDGAPTDNNGNDDLQGLEKLMRHEREIHRTYVTFLACTDDAPSVAYLSQWDHTMNNVDVVDDYKTEREKIRRVRGSNYSFTFGDYVVKALIGAVDPQMDALDEK